MKTPEFLEISLDPIDKEGISKREDTLELNGSKKDFVGYKLRIRFSKKHSRYHEYMIMDQRYNTLRLEKVAPEVLE